MNLCTNPTQSQWNAHWEALAEAMVGATVAPKAFKKSKHEVATEEEQRRKRLALLHHYLYNPLLYYLIKEGRGGL